MPGSIEGTQAFLHVSCIYSNWSEFALKRPKNTDRKPLFLVFIVSTQNYTLFLLFQCVMLLHISWNYNKCRFFKEGSKGIAPGPALINEERHLETHRNGEKAARWTLLHSLVQAEESEEVVYQLCQAPTGSLREQLVFNEDEGKK